MTHNEYLVLHDIVKEYTPVNMTHTTFDAEGDTKICSIPPSPFTSELYNGMFSIHLKNHLTVEEIIEISDKLKQYSPIDSLEVRAITGPNSSESYRYQHVGELNFIFNLEDIIWGQVIFNFRT